MVVAPLRVTLYITYYVFQNIVVALLQLFFSDYYFKTPA